MDVAHYLRILRRRWLSAAACVVLGLVAAAAYILVRPPTYVSTAELFIATGASSSVADLSQGNLFAQQAVKSYADVATTSYVLDPVVTKLKLPFDAEILAGRVNVSVPVDTVVMSVSVTDSNGRRASEIANSIGEQLVQTVSDLSVPGSDSSSQVKVTLVQRASPAVLPAPPEWYVVLLAGGGTGALVGLLIVVLLDRADTRIRTVEQVESLDLGPVVAGIVFDGQTSADPIARSGGDSATRSENFKTLRTNLQYLDVDEDGVVYLITSSIPGEGKTTSTANLAYSLSEAGSSVVVVDADLRRPRLDTYLGIDGSIGLTDAISGLATIEEVMQSWGETTLSVIPAGGVAPNPSELLGSKSMRALLKVLKARFDYVVLDGPPLLPVSDGAILAGSVDKVLVVAAAGHVRIHQLKAAASVLDHVSIRPAGFIVTMLPTRGPDSYVGAYGTYEGYRRDNPGNGD